MHLVVGLGNPGRQYDVVFEPSRLPSPRTGPPVRASVGLPAVARTPSTTVVRMLPTADVLPENLLRIYLEFSAPMSRENGRDFIKLLVAHHTVIDPTLNAFEDLLVGEPGKVIAGLEPMVDRLPPQTARGYLLGGLPIDADKHAYEFRLLDGFGCEHPCHIAGRYPDHASGHPRTPRGRRLNETSSHRGCTQNPRRRRERV